DDPLQGALPDVEIPLDRGQGDIHDRDVEHDHKLRHAYQKEDDSFVGVELGCHDDGLLWRSGFGSASARCPYGRMNGGRQLRQHALGGSDDLVGDVWEAVTNSPVGDEAQRHLVAGLAEQALAGPEHERVDHQPQLVGEIVVDQRADELETGGYYD